MAPYLLMLKVTKDHDAVSSLLAEVVRSFLARHGFKTVGNSRDSPARNLFNLHSKRRRVEGDSRTDVPVGHKEKQKSKDLFIRGVRIRSPSTPVSVVEKRAISLQLKMKMN